MRIIDWSSDVCSSDLGSDLHGAALVGASLAIVPRRRTRPLKPSRYSHRVEMHLHGTIRSHLTVAIADVAVLAGAPAAAQDSAVARLEVLQTEISKLQKEVAVLKRDVAKGRQRSEEHTSALQSLMRI